MKEKLPKIEDAEITSEGLTDEDLEIYKKFEDETLTFEEFQKYRQSVLEHVDQMTKANPDYQIEKDKRYKFYKWLDNKWISKEAVEKLIKKEK